MGFRFRFRYQPTNQTCCTNQPTNNVVPTKEMIDFVSNPTLKGSAIYHTARLTNQSTYTYKLATVL